MKTFLLTGLGFLLLGMGAVGLFLPVWPTTPFVLAAVGCLSGSPRVRARIVRFPFVKEHMDNYSKRTGLRRKTLLVSLGYLWGMLFLSGLLLRSGWILLLLAGVGCAVTAHLLWIARPKRKKPAGYQA